MTRCPNCYNSITPDTTSCPSCAYLLIQAEKPATSQVFASAPAAGEPDQSGEVRKSGRLGSGRLLAGGEQNRNTVSSGNRTTGSRPRPTTGSRPGPTTGSRPGTTTGSRPGAHSRSRQTAQAKADEKAAGWRKLILLPVTLAGLVAVAFLLAPATELIKPLMPQVDPETSVSALTMFRSQPSKLPGKTVDQCVNEWINESQKSGNLVRYSGWSIKPIRFAKSKLFVSFSFEEKDGVRNAEWRGDVASKTFIPTNDLAAEVYGTKN